MVATYIKKDHAQYDLCDSGLYSREMIDVFFVCLVSGLVESFNFGIYSGKINVINVKISVMLLLIELDLFIPLS